MDPLWLQREGYFDNQPGLSFATAIGELKGRRITLSHRHYSGTREAIVVAISLLALYALKNWYFSRQIYNLSELSWQRNISCENTYNAHIDVMVETDLLLSYVLGFFSVCFVAIFAHDYFSHSNSQLKSYAAEIVKKRNVEQLLADLQNDPNYDPLAAENAVPNVYIQRLEPYLSRQSLAKLNFRQLAPYRASKEIFYFRYKFLSPEVRAQNTRLTFLLSSCHRRLSEALSSVHHRSTLTLAPFLFERLVQLLVPSIFNEQLVKKALKDVLRDLVAAYFGMKTLSDDLCWQMLKLIRFDKYPLKLAYMEALKTIKDIDVCYKGMIFFQTNSTFLKNISSVFYRMISDLEQIQLKEHVSENVAMKLSLEPVDPTFLPLFFKLLLERSFSIDSLAIKQCRSLAKLADYYDVRVLRDKISSHLCQNLSNIDEQSLRKLAQFAGTYNLEGLRLATQKKMLVRQCQYAPLSVLSEKWLKEVSFAHKYKLNLYVHESKKQLKRHCRSLKKKATERLGEKIISFMALIASAYTPLLATLFPCFKPLFEAKPLLLGQLWRVIQSKKLKKQISLFCQKSENQHLMSANWVSPPSITTK